MSEADEKPVRLRFACAAEADVAWEISGLQRTGRLTEPYQLRLGLRTDDGAAEPMAMLGAAITVTIERGPLTRELCGIVELVEDGLADHEHVLACLSVVPALTALAHRK